MNNDTIKLIRKTSNVNSLMVIIFYMLDIALIRLGDLAVYHIAGKSAYYEDIAQLVSYCILKVLRGNHDHSVQTD